MLKNFNQYLQLFFLIAVMSFLTAKTYSQQNDSARSRQDSLARMMEEYKKVQKEYAEKQKEYEEQMEDYSQPKMFGARLDILFGYTSSNAVYDINTAVNNIQTGTKNGAFIGANVTLSLMGFSFTTGLSYSGKGFKTNTGNTTNMNYFNIPLLLSFNFNVGKVLIEPSVGPYVGILLSSSSSMGGSNDSLFKNIDIGILGSLQGTYMFQKHIGALLGFKYEYGGLNNLSQNTENTFNTKTWTLYSGVKFVF